MKTQLTCHLTQHLFILQFAVHGPILQETTFEEAFNAIEVIQRCDFRYICLMSARYPDYKRSFPLLTLIWSNNDDRTNVSVNTILLISVSVSMVVMFVIYVYLVEI